MKKGIFSFYAGGEKEREAQSRRYEALVAQHEKEFAPRPVSLFSVPGRIELIGNHTDHNRGRVLAAAVNLDCIAAASPTAGGKVAVFSKGYDRPFVVDLGQLDPQRREEGTTTALIRGIACRLARSGRRIGGFDASIDSDILPGSGLSSSAAIEVLIGTIFNHLFNQGKIGPLEIAMASRFSENRYFGKPCGLMDQVACACGGVLHIDFRDPRSPVIEKVTGSGLARRRFSLVVVTTGGGHADLTAEYAAVPREMKKVARALGGSFLRESALEELLRSAPLIRARCGDRAFLRACHFFLENERVALGVRALRENRVARFLSLLKGSGLSSFCYLQNVHRPGDPRFQPLAVALALSENFISSRRRGACRVHGGGFAGTVLAVIHEADLADYVGMMEAVFGPGSAKKLKIRRHGALFLGEA